MISKVYIGIGTNLSDREKNIDTALTLIKKSGIDVIKMSTVLETKPVEYTNQPDFLNCIIHGQTDLRPHILLNTLLSVERSMGRKRDIPKGPRIIDLDILLYNNEIIDSPTLTVPHPEIKNRQFILQHLVELDKNLLDPVTGQAYASMLKE